MEVGDELHVPAALSLRKSPRYYFTSRPDEHNVRKSENSHTYAIYAKTFDSFYRSWSFSVMYSCLAGESVNRNQFVRTLLEILCAKCVWWGKGCLCPWTIRRGCWTARWVFMSEMARQIATTLLAGWLRLTPGIWPALATSTIPPAASSDHTLYLKVSALPWYFVQGTESERNYNLRGNKWRGGILRRKEDKFISIIRSCMCRNIKIYRF
jgi:hypothetical protein